MRDPHVETLYYKITSFEDVSYDDPVPLGFSNLIADFALANGVLSVILLEHFSTEASAREVVESFLQSWEMGVDLTSNLGTIRFEFDHSEIVDRDPPQPGESVSIMAGSGSMTCIGKHVTLRRTYKEYPNPPTCFDTNSAIKMAYRRWVRYKEGKEPLQAMAYFVLTIPQDAAGSRANAVPMFKIERGILNNIGTLSTERGDENTARKASAIPNILTPTEKEWLEKATTMLIIQMGKHAAGRAFEQLRMSDLPEL